MTSKEQKIIHIDMDAFYAAVEQRDHPDYQEKPVVVGGNPFSRGVVSTASYEARTFGIRSAMPAAKARQLCPEAIFVKPRMDVYRQVSKEIRAVFFQHTDLVECVSLDEAYLDVSENKLGIEDPYILATMIKQNIFAVTHLTASAGIANNMFLAKIASDYKKPDGLMYIRSHEVARFLRDLPVRKIPGVGPVTEENLKKYDVCTCGDVLERGKAWMHARFGRMGIQLFERSQGYDNRIVEPRGESKQYSTEETFEKDVLDIDWMCLKLRDYATEIYSKLTSQARMGKTVVLKVKYGDFEQITRSRTLPQNPASAVHLSRVAEELLKSKTLAGKKPIRLLGLGLSGLQSGSREKVGQQQELSLD